MLYADDSIFVGEWEESNVKCLNRILRIFYLLSGLKVNQRKSQLYGVGIQEEEVEGMASVFNCKPGKFPFIYLGLKVGANMNKIANWKEVIEMFNKRLSNWKAKNLSFTGRVVLVKSVLDNLPNYYLSLYKCPIGVLKILEGIQRKFLWGGNNKNNKIRWVKWEKIVALKDFVGLGIGNIRDMNLALLAKWWWRLKTEPENLWVNVIKLIHTSQRKMEQIPIKKSMPGVWKNIGEIGKEFSKNNIDIVVSLRSKVGMGNNTMFLVDTWPAYNQKKGIGKRVLSGYQWWDNLGLGVGKDSKYGNRTKGVTESKYSFATTAYDFEWNRWTTNKSLMFVWRAMEEKIPTVTALRSRGMNIRCNVQVMRGCRRNSSPHPNSV
ncbi:uncharacterized protein LOC118485801 [Helianthus annuus]|uniref:uncharacterized protein LOC118485801 n=1 Tax=Helianthus annuus TaxID=4232 RepID=UPI0016532D21|nr:uncharacterized protein LOC118485801 [Helianthus annuus]